jgi:ribosome-binding protein aMBF1 (putative translation factor)
MICINPYSYTEASSRPSTTAEFLFTELFPDHPFVGFVPPISRFSSEEEVFSRLFPDEESRRELAEEQDRWNQMLIDRIRMGKVNPVRGWRILKGIDQKTLAKRTKIRQPNLSRMEKLGARPSLPSLKKVAKALKIDLKELL